uniref:Pectinesterase inhibitor domain-containing protein n=1 Tax=Setaria viridis TaxID=4556 RepID=A0A4U6UF47_SETVI|nr:hypothetical protein SEVIR_6G064800v2 [Setaria viridis]
MKKAVVLVLAASLAAASLSGIGDACAGVPSMPIDTACRAASTGPAMYSLCMSILQSLPPSGGDLVTYAVGAAGAAALSCDTATRAGEGMLGDGSLPGELRDACSGCVADYGNARQAISGVADQLGRCEFAYLRQGYMDALAAVEDCTAKLGLAGGTSTPLYGMVVGSRDRTVIAFRLASSLMA